MLVTWVSIQETIAWFNDFPDDIEAYLQQEHSHGALLGPFDENPIKGGISSPS